MSDPVSVRLDDEIRKTLEEEARARKLGLSTYLRDIAIREARRVRRDRIRLQSRAVGAYIAATPEAQAFYDDLGSSDTEGL
ncbi:MAG TPA: hypothetical protein VHT04_09935 [Stellaceae bacterium]|jgi:uncharacterized protein (DUF1778 family)|nr:hypothetical protein [Stellaceae bacterium]